MTEKLDEKLIKVDALAVRWASAERDHGSLHPLEAIRLLHDGAVLGGGPIPTPADILAFDQCMHEEGWCRYIITLWYKSTGTVDHKAKRIGISRSKLYAEWKGALQYIRGWLKARAIDV